MTLKTGIYLLSTLLLTLCIQHSAWALTCTVSAPTVTFEPYSPVTDQPLTTSATLIVQCTQGALELYNAAYICLNLGTGTAGDTLNPRTLMSETRDTLQYNLYQDPNYSQIWSSDDAGIGGSISLDLALPMNTGGSASTTVRIYGRLVSGQSQAMVSNFYQSVFSGLEARVLYQGYTLNRPSCASMPQPSNATFSMTVNASVINDCTINTNSLDFGNHAFLFQSVTSTTTIRVSCSNGANYNITLDGGTSTGLVQQRQMANGIHRVNYQLYLDSAQTTVWGDGLNGSAIQSGVGTGTSQSYTIYGSLPPQTLPAAGDYLDTITATIIY